MPRTLAPELRRCLKRANPHVATFVELSKPDQSAVLHRAEDQFLSAPPRVTETPAASTAASPSGALTLASSGVTLINQFVDGGGVNIPQEDLEHYVNTAAWDIDRSFGGGVLRSVTVRLKYISGLLGPKPDLKLLIFRATQQAGVLQRQEGSSLIEVASREITFTQLLAEPVIVKWATIFPDIDGSGFVTVRFDLTPYHLLIEPISGAPASPSESGPLPTLYFSVQTTQTTAGNFVEWRRDTTSSQNIAGVGRVRELSWIRADFPGAVWVSSEAVNDALMMQVEFDSYAATSQAVYALTLPALPDPLSLGRVVFNRGVPAGTAATLELSTAGSGGPFTAVTHGDPVTVQQLTYHARLTLTASADQRRAPVVSALGLEFRDRVDVSAEAIVTPMSQEIAVPFLTPSIGEGAISIVRTGRRDYADAGSALATGGADTQLEADIYLGSRHPAVTRDHWLHQTRATVSNRRPGPTTESLSLLSLAKTLKRKIPAQVESINQLVTVSSALTTQITVLEDLAGTTATGNEYDGAGYYIRVRSSSVTGLTGTVWDIVGNTGRNAIDFGGLPTGTFAAGDLLEVHSGRFIIPTLEWINADPADVWWEVFTVHLQVPPERIGFSEVGQANRSGLPPRASDRAPGDETERQKLLVTLRLKGEELGDELIDQVSFIMGGATVEVAGQFVFVQIYQLVNSSGVVTVPCAPVAAVFDARDYIALDTPTGREQRISLLSCAHGVDSTAAAPLAPSVVQLVDVDALASLGLQDVEGLGTATIPDAIARWCFNSVDGGALLARMLIQQVLRASSTGVRPWPWSTVDAFPELMVGDTVIVITDQYTDYDPARRAEVKGWHAYPLTLIGTGEGGKRFLGFLQGLANIGDVTIRGGVGGTLDASAPKILRVSYVDVGGTRVFTIERNSAADSIWVYDNNVPAGSPDPYLTATTFDALLGPGVDTYVAAHPEADTIQQVHFVPRTLLGTAGDVWDEPIYPVPSTLDGSVLATAPADTADLTLVIRGSQSNWPVAWELREDSEAGTVVTSGSVSAETTITPSDDALLGGLALPLREQKRWYLVLVDVAGVRVVRHGSADRGALPYGVVTPTDFRANPILSDEYDEDTDVIKLTLPDARTLTVSVSGGGTWTYTPGDVLDDSTTESAFADGEERGPYLVEHQGGGEWRTFYNGPLHGAPVPPPVLPTAPSFTSLSYGGSPDYSLNTIDIGWVPANAPVGATYNVTVYEQTHPTNPARGNTYEFVGVTSPFTYSCINDIDAGGSLTKTFKAFVSMIDGTSVVINSATETLVLNSNT